ncbi:MAG: hypothetical protein K6F84_08330 [Lachnospiraceae bacterium]|nr:hypothetical protein [Lachnospiraceae bacterium]
MITEELLYGGEEQGIVEGIASPMRCFLVNDDVKESMIHKFNYIYKEKQLLLYANGESGTISDCYILLAISSMGVATKEMIKLFLKKVTTDSPDLSIVDADMDDSGLTSRLKYLLKIGYIYAFNYQFKRMINGKPASTAITLYSVVNCACEMIGQRLQRKVVINEGFQHKIASEIVGWVAASYVGMNVIANSTTFDSYLERVCKTKHMGTFFLPMEAKFEKDDVFYYVAFKSAFFEWNKASQSKKDYEEWCERQLYIIKNYLNCRTTKGVAECVVVVRDSEDLEFVSKMFRLLINKDENLLSRVFFTSEGNFRGTSDGPKFLTYVNAPKTEEGYQLIAATPHFL